MKTIAKGNLYMGIALVMAAGIFWGSMGTAVQYLFSLGTFKPLALVEIRLVCAGLILLAGATLIAPKATWAVWTNRRDAVDVTVSGLALVGSHATFFQAIYYSNAGTAAIILTLVPLIAAVWLAMRGKRRLGLTDFICFVLATAGVALIITDGDFGGLVFSPLALFWGLASSLCATVYSVQPVKLIARAGVIPVVTWGTLLGGIAATFFVQPWNSGIVWDTGSLLAFAYIVLFGTVVAFAAFLAGLKYVSPVIAGLLNCMEPLSAIFFSMALLGDRMGLWQWLGVVLVLSNVVLIALARKAS